ncbi:MAG: serine hydrolase domain-containing protein [Alphaproteobacteria bacterium]
MSERSLGAILREDICAPLGIDFWIGLPESEDGRVAEQQLPRSLPDLGPLTDAKRAAFMLPWAAPRADAAWRRVEIPSANGHGTALSVAQLFSAYANAGKIGDMRLIDPQTFSELTAQRINDDDLVMPFRMSWAAGVMINNNKIYGPNSRTLAHAGRGGSFGLGDPGRGISAGYVMNKLAPALQTDERGQRLIKALYACV